MLTDIPRLVVTAGGIALIAAVLLFFFGPRRCTPAACAPAELIIAASGLRREPRTVYDRDARPAR